MRNISPIYLRLAGGGIGEAGLANRVRSRGLSVATRNVRGMSQRRFAKELCLSSHFVASVGYVSESTLRRYIEFQWDAVAG